ncbi:hypothetical protein [Haliovirga abyssi]|uniref:DUF4269 domain-containing protein n=1 Tax=Haliovirga abyssi TaxID=2996794 RepID=A0AAU9DW04_9FUSO|nr:hypothetical protein [Haliovirga abyssi]BDU50416.1 hypothetical protein HLVA_09850 [Haliovirga abyssi]
MIKILSKYGLPIVIGSYELDLMFDEDIDIVVETGSPRESSIKVLNEFIRTETFQKYEYGDFEKYTRLNRPNGFIVNLKIEYENKNWEIEIWFFKNISDYKIQLNKYKELINSEKKLKILQRKFLRKEKGKTKHEISSISIYNEILL